MDKRIGAEEAHQAHNLGVEGSKLSSAIFFHFCSLLNYNELNKKK